MSKQPIVPVKIASQSNPNLSYPGGLGGGGGAPLHQTPSSGGSPSFNDPSSGIFVPTWNMWNDSRLSVCTNSMEFARHSFPPVAITDMDAMGIPVMVHNVGF